MKWTTIEELKSLVRDGGFPHRAVLSDEEDARLAELLDAHPEVITTPGCELRYIEGLLDFPYGFIDEFKVIPAPDSQRCACGRVPSALDIVAYAHRRNIHSARLIRNALLGMENIFEPAEAGREADCIGCGRGLTMFAYWKKGYKYA